MKIQILDKAKKKKLLPRLECFGIKKIPQLLVKGGNERVCAYSGSLSVEEIMDLWRILPFEKVGLYIGKEVSKNPHDGDFRLSLDGLHIWKDQINNQIFVLTEEQEEEWFKGKNIELNETQKNNFLNIKGFFAVKSFDEKDLVGTGKISNGVLYNFLPKERRRKVM
jgi:NOL1/NOP2/fmu family ribosome biogenesis protein